MGADDVYRGELPSSVKCPKSIGHQQELIDEMQSLVRLVGKKLQTTGSNNGSVSSKFIKVIYLFMGGTLELLL